MSVAVAIASSVGAALVVDSVHVALPSKAVTQTVKFAASPRCAATIVGVADWNGQSFVSALASAVRVATGPERLGVQFGQTLGQSLPEAYRAWRAMVGTGAQAEEFMQIVYASSHEGRTSVGVHYTQVNGDLLSLVHQEWRPVDDAVVAAAGLQSAELAASTTEMRERRYFAALTRQYPLDMPEAPPLHGLAWTPTQCADWAEARVSAVIADPPTERLPAWWPRELPAVAAPVHRIELPLV